MKHTVALKQNHEFRRLYSKGKSAVTPYLALYYRKNRLGYNRLGITTGLTPVVMPRRLFPSRFFR